MKGLEAQAPAYSKIQNVRVSWQRPWNLFTGVFNSVHLSLTKKHFSFRQLPVQCSPRIQASNRFSSPWPILQVQIIGFRYLEHPDHCYLPETGVAITVFVLFSEWQNVLCVFKSIGPIQNSPLGLTPYFKPYIHHPQVSRFSFNASTSSQKATCCGSWFHRGITPEWKDPFQPEASFGSAVVSF